MDPNTKRPIAERAQTQVGFITTDQIRAEGVHRSTIHRRIASGLWVPAGRCTLRLASTTAGREVAVLAACLDLDAVASHRTAASRRGLLPWSRAIDVSVPKGRTTKGFHSPDDLRIHTSTKAPPDESSRSTASP